MKKIITILTLFICLFSLNKMYSQDTTLYNVTITGILFYEANLPAAGYEVHYYDPNHPTFAEWTVITDDNGMFTIEYESYTNDGCGLIYFAGCNGDVVEKEVCYTRDHSQFDFQFHVCSDHQCFKDVEITETLTDDGLYHLVLALPEDQEYRVQWSNGAAGIEVIVPGGEEICVNIYGANCSFFKCIYPGGRPDCDVKIIDESHAGGFGFLFAESYGNGEMKYEWNNGSNEQFIEILQPGEYCVTVTYADGCRARDCIEIDTIWIEDCWVYIQEVNGDAGTFLEVQNIGRGQILEYLWSTGETTATIFPESSGYYEVKVIFDTGCVTSASHYFLKEGDCNVEIYCDLTDFGGGGLFADAKGAQPIEYRWSNGSKDPWIRVIKTGEYCVSITDANGCKSRACKYIEVDTSYNCDVIISNIYTDDGRKGLLAEGKFKNDWVQFIWSTGETTQAIFPVHTGEYCVTVISGNCIVDLCIWFVREGDCAVDVAIAAYTGPNFGGIEAHAIGYGHEPFQYLWSTGSQSQIIRIEKSGDYCVTLTDAVGCVAEWCGYIEADGTSFCEAYIGRERNDENGIYYKVYAYGAEPFEYQWDNDKLMGDSVVITEPGVYCVTVIAADGCTVSTCIEVRDDKTCKVDIDYTVGIAGDTFLIARVITVSSNYKLVWSTGEVGNEIIYPGGNVCVTLTEGTTGCTDIACWDGNSENGLFTFTGGVRDPENPGKLLDPKVTVYSMDSDSNIIVVDAFIEYYDNYFQMEVRHPGPYLLKAEVEGYIPTYYQNAIFWDEAEWIDAGDASIALVYEIIMVREDGTGGNGVISGNVSAGSNVRIAVGSFRSGDPMDGVEVILTDEHGNPLRAVFTDQSGYYEFRNLPLGSYRLYTEIAGEEQQMIEVELTEEQPEAADVSYDFGGEGTTTNTEENDILNEVTLFPNPVGDRLNINLGSKIEGNSTTIKVFDNLGRELIFLNKIEVQNGLSNIDVSALTKGGLYHAVINTNVGRITKRFIKID